MEALVEVGRGLVIIVADGLCELGRERSCPGVDGRDGGCFFVNRGLMLLLLLFLKILSVV